ncbi:MAG TPA: PSD1 and planctomycete cytochrome C domain-containing protein [Verrucomicrobiae bacterium]|nr:PSD1 and planctomycete cytochrome C domain-containing protein [Verrucomicrobiae bacterium]
MRLDTREGALRVREDVAAILPGNSAKSAVYQRITTTDPDDVMPPAKTKRVLTSAQKDLIRRWIDAGAPWGQHWAFEKLNPSAPPVTPASARWSRQALDAFVFERLAQEGLRPSPAADKVTLIRRVTLDLTGLPPTPEEVNAFLTDKSAGAYDKVVRRLLESPAFGERMAWDWLDAARYSDTNGYQGDSKRTMWPWRDWVVQAFNRNLPYDRFTILQLAGDLLPNAGLEEKLPTGFLRNHMINGEGGRIPEENRVDYVMDMAETTGTVWLGLTFNCCRCHDHKFDPLAQRDYYSLYAFFNQTPVDGSGGSPQTKPVVEVVNPGQAAQRTRLKEDISGAVKRLEDFETSFFPREKGKTAADSERVCDLKQPLKDILKLPAEKRGAGQLGDLEKEFEKSAPDYAALLKGLRTPLEERDRLEGAIPRVMVMEDMPKPRMTFMLEKGIYDKPLAEVTAAVPAKLAGTAPGPATNRLGLARWLVAPENPLTARVTVNRFWQQFFGVGLVKTAEDFGVQGERPSNPELLDWLAAEFIRSGWDVKELCRLMVTSATYRQTSKVSPALQERDPENRLLGRAPRFRMPAWMIRDQALAASGLLARKMGGEAVNSYQPPGVWEDATFGAKKYFPDKGEDLHRRSLYTFWRRIVAPTIFFDNAARQVCTVRKERTNTPLQALTTLNDDTFVEAARALAQMALQERRASEDERIDFVFRRVLARKPVSAERKVFHASLARLRKEFAADSRAAKDFLHVGEAVPDGNLDATELAAYSALCLTVLNLDEAVTKE